MGRERRGRGSRRRKKERGRRSGRRERRKRGEENKEVSHTQPMHFQIWAPPTGSD